MPAKKNALRTDVDPAIEGTLPFSNEILHGQLNNGLKYYIMKNDLPSDKVELRLNVRTGSLNETDAELGIAHFVEHMAFNGTRDYPGTEVVKFMERAGLTFGQHSNAYTSFDNTQYMLTIPASDKELLTESFSIMRNWADRVLFETDEIEREKGIIIEEWRMRNDARRRIYQKFTSYLQTGSLYPERQPIGDMDIVRNADRALLKGYYDKWYTANNMSVIVVGNMDVNEAEKLIKKNFSSMKKKDSPTPANSAVPLTKGLRVEKISDPEVTSSRLSIMYIFESAPVKTYEQLKAEELISGAASMLSERLSNKANSGEIDLLDFSVYTTQIAHNLSMLQIGFTTTPERLEADTATVLAEIERVSRYGFSKSETDIYKKGVTATLELVASPDYKIPSAKYVYEISNYDTYGGYLTDANQDKALYDKLFRELSSLDYSKAFAKTIDTKSMLVIATISDEDAAKINLNKEIWAQKLKVAANKELSPPEEIKTLNSLLDTVPASGEIISTQNHPNIDGVLLKYSNGVNLFVKRNNYESGRFSLLALKPGGYAVLSDQDAKEIDLVPAIILSSGLQNISMQQLKNYFKDKQISINIGTSKNLFTINMDGSSKDVSPGFQLLHKYFTSATVDNSAMLSALASNKAYYESMEKNKETAFLRMVSEKMYNNKYRREYPLSSELDNISAEQILRLYTNNFTDASNFIFVITGDIDIDAVAQLGRIYLGSLPASSYKARTVDRGVSFAQASGSATGYGDSENKTTLLLRLENDGLYYEDGKIYAELFSNVLRQRMREKIREEMGSAYSISVNISYTDYPVAYFSGGIYLTCDPRMKDEILENINIILEDIAKNGITEEELIIAKKQYIVQLANRNESNSYWSNQIAGNIISNRKVISAAETEQLVSSYKLNDINEFIRSNMKNIRTFVTTYNPENTRPADAK